MEYASWIAHSWMWRAKPTKMVGKVSECEVCSAPRIFIGLFSICQFRCHLHSSFEWNDINFISIFRWNDPAILLLTLVDAIRLWNFLVRRGCCRITYSFQLSVFFDSYFFFFLPFRADLLTKTKRGMPPLFPGKKEGKKSKNLNGCNNSGTFCEYRLDILHLHGYAVCCWMLIL